MYNQLMTKDFRRKRSDTKVGSIEKQYGVDFGVRSDKELGKFLKESGFPSLSKALDQAQKKKK
jgi:hypothetical protein